MSEFILDARLKADTTFLFDWPLCRVLLMGDANYPWVILVPRVLMGDGESIKELYDLNEAQRLQLDRESTTLARYLMQQFNGDKLNVAALGNVVSQLHIHHVVRFEYDSAWPLPVWGKCAAKPYDDAELLSVKATLVDDLALHFADA